MDKKARGAPCPRGSLRRSWRRSWFGPRSRPLGATTRRCWCYGPRSPLCRAGATCGNSLHIFDEPKLCDMYRHLSYMFAALCKLLKIICLRSCHLHRRWQCDANIDICKATRLAYHFKACHRLQMRDINIFCTHVMHGILAFCALQLARLITSADVHIDSVMVDNPIVKNLE